MRSVDLIFKTQNIHKLSSGSSGQVHANELQLCTVINSEQKNTQLLSGSGCVWNISVKKEDT